MQMAFAQWELKKSDFTLVSSSTFAIVKSILTNFYFIFICYFLFQFIKVNLLYQSSAQSKNMSRAHVITHDGNSQVLIMQYDVNLFNNIIDVIKKNNKVITFITMSGQW
jgi:hypothetical protein